MVVADALLPERVHHDRLGWGRAGSLRLVRGKKKSTMRNRLVLAVPFLLLACGSESPEDEGQFSANDPSPDEITAPGMRTTVAASKRPILGRLRPPKAGGSGGTGGSTGGTGGTGGIGGSTGETGGTGGATGGTGGTGSAGSAGGITSDSCVPSPPQGAVYYVAPNGSDAAGSGSSASPWATIGYAVGQVSDGATVLVRPGEYAGLTKIDGKFANGITIRSEQPYQARLRNNGTVLRCFYGVGITVEGFDIAHSGPGAAPLVVQIQDVNGDGGCSRITLRNNILHDSYNNDILKINNAASNVLVEHNVFYNQFGSDEHMDVNSVEDVTIQHNIFFNDFAGSGRANPHDTSSFVVIKDSNGSDDRFVGASGVTVRGNVFLHYEGSSGTPFLLLGEDGHPYFEARNVLVENNLMLGDGADTMRAAFGCKGVADVVFRNNTVSGNLPSSAFAMRLNVEGSNQPNQNIQFFNNLWSDPTGTMTRFSTTPFGETSTFTLHNNAYWNAGNPLPYSANDLVNPENDAHAVTGEPGLPSPSSIVLPRWNPQTGKLADGSANVCAAFVSLVQSFGTPAASSALVDQAESGSASPEDILGRVRGGSPDLGAVER
jgi:hypothetical protein